jgi:AraC-like DNA-binding protein
MLLLQAALCFSANGLMLFLAALLLRDARGLVAARLGSALFLGSVGYSLNLLPGPLRLPSPLYEIAALANVPTLGLGLLFCRALLLDGFRMGPREWALLAGLSVPMFLASRRLIGLPDPGQDAVEAVLGVAGAAVIAHLLWISVTGYRDDLLDARRRVRIGVVVFALLNAVAVSIVELRGMSITAEGLVFDSGTLVICIVILFWIVRTAPERFFSVPASSERAERAAQTGPSPRQRAAKSKLLVAMEDDAAWRDEGLTIGRLAGRTGVPEHQLRALINGDMGHRNFAAYLNSYRLAEAKARLADPQQADIPILTIAMESGYRTLSTFNRAFKAQEDETPSAYRGRSLRSGGDAESDTVLAGP